MKRLLATEESLRRLIETGITVGSIGEPLYTVDRDQVGPKLAKDLRKRSFDRCGVTAEGRVVGTVSLKSLKSGQPVEQIGLDRLAAETTPLWNAMPRIVEQGWLLLLPADGEMTIVTAADLAKQPPRLLMFGLVSLLEMTMLALIRREYDEAGVQESLPAGRARKARDLLEERRKANQETDLVDCLQLCDEATLCKKSDRIREALEFDSKGKCQSTFGEIESLRNLLAHGRHPAPNGEWQAIVDLVAEIDRLIGAGLELLKNESEGVSDV